VHVTIFASPADKEMENVRRKVEVIAKRQSNDLMVTPLNALA